MRRWGVGLVLVLLACIPILASRSSSPGLLHDTDTRFLLERIRERDAPLSWFAGDWPLGNHFYRPVSTLAFEMDNALHGENAAGYGWTNAIICALCVPLLYWFLRELTDSPALSVAGALFFAMWTVGVEPGLAGISYLLAGIALVGGFLRHGLAGRRYLPAALILWFLPHELPGIVNHVSSGFSYRVIGWLPGRTASVMTLFAILSLAAYARFERLGAPRRPPPDPGPLDPPATRSSTVESGPVSSWPWALVSALALALALGSYEQAVMLPACLLATGLAMRLQRYQIRWAWHGVFWLVLALYLVARARLVPTDVSGYQAQQLRHSASIAYAILDFLFPLASAFPVFLHSLSAGPYILMTAGPWDYLARLAGNVVAYAEARRAWIPAMAGWSLSILAFLPMAWLKVFEHYYFWPMAMRALFVASLAWVALMALVSAVSPPARQAPPRPSPAPGSLPRR